MDQRVVVAGRELIIVARVNSGIGIKGGVKNAPIFFTPKELKELFVEFPEDLYILKGKQFPRKISVSNVSSDNRYVKMDVEGVGTRTEADKLGGSLVAVLYSSYLKYLDDTKSVFRYIGYMVRDINIGDVGVIDSIIRQGQTLFVIRTNVDQEVLVPFVDELVESIDDKKKLIKMDLPEGLF